MFIAAFLLFVYKKPYIPIVKTRGFTAKFGKERVKDKELLERVIRPVRMQFGHGWGLMLFKPMSLENNYNLKV